MTTMKQARKHYKSLNSRQSFRSWVRAYSVYQEELCPKLKQIRGEK